MQLAQAAHRSRTPFVYASSCNVYGQVHELALISEDWVDDRSRCTGPLNSYGRSKLHLDELMLDTYGASDWYWVGLRYTNVFGPRERLKRGRASILAKCIEATVRREPVRLFADTLTAARDFIHVDVVAARLVSTLQAGGPSGIYNLGTGVPVTLGRLLEWCAELASEPSLRLELVPNPYRDMYQYWNCVDNSRWTAAFGPCVPLAESDIKLAVSAVFRELRDGPAGS
jgi:ADP-L-glycero-D-manno-heptose 6-epimerase